jgi:hypothetical protein
MERSLLASLVLSSVAASTICFASTTTPATAGDIATAHFFGPGVFLGNMIKNGNTSPTVISVDVEEKTKSIMYAWVVYNKKTCAEITPGKWTINVKPKHGTDTLAPYKFSFTCNGASHAYTGAGIYYTSTGPASAAPHDLTIATWTAAAGTQHFKEYDEFKITITP